MPAADKPLASTRTFVLVHGAWHGGWCWNEVAGLLRAQGHRVFTPSLSGLGERAHLLSPEIGLNQFVQDVVDLLVREDLTDVILVGHSFGGLPVLGAADRVPQRIAHLVFLDAVILENGQSALSRVAPELAAARRRQAQESSGGLTIPVPPASAFGVSEPVHIALLERYCTPHPLKTYEDPMVLGSPVGNGLARTYIQCVSPVYAPLESSREFVRAQKDWALDEIETGHDAMVSAPRLLADKLLAFA